MNGLLKALAVISVFAQFAAAQDFNPVIDLKNKAVLTPLSAPRAIEFADNKAGGDRLKYVAGANPQEKLKNLFEEGIPALERELAGWHSGRFYDASRNVFKGALLAFWKAPAAENNGGPLFQEESVPQAIILTEEEPAFYDNLPIDQQLKVQYFINSREHVFMLKFPGAKAVYEDSASRTQMEERSARGYIVERLTVLEKATGVKHEFYSYYFKTVTPKK